MNYIVITTKHHDGFCLFDTKTTDYNIVQATPFKQDVIKLLSEACERHDLGFGIYYSLVDWHLGHSFDYDNNKDRKSTRLNSSHVAKSYAVFCLKKKNHNLNQTL